MQEDKKGYYMRGIEKDSGFEGTWKEKALNLAVNTQMSWRKIAQEIGVPRSTVSDYLRTVIYKMEDNSGLKVCGPKILVLDIETAYIELQGWRLFKENFSVDQIQRDWYMLSFAAKWLDEDSVYYEDVRNTPGDDASILQMLWKLLDQADWVIAHNGVKFDLPKIRARMIIQGMKPFSPVKVIDTFQVAKKVFGFTSNKLMYISGVLCEDVTKSEHAKFPGFSLWKECMNGNPEAWDEMRDYNIKDILSLEEVYLKMRPWIPNHPNFSLYTDNSVLRCVCCGSDKLTRVDKDAPTMVSLFPQYVCEECGKHSRGRKNVRSREEMNNTLTNSL